MNPVTIEERKAIQLSMLDEIDCFCRENEIKYSIAFGTLLGAVRHKGFIPWDDDVDIMMSLPDLLTFKERFKSESITYYDVDIDNKYCYPFSRLAYNKTYAKDGLVAKTIGVCIDLYVVIGLPRNDEQFFYKVNSLYNKRLDLMKWRSFIISKLPVSNIPFYSKTNKAYRDLLFNESREYSESSKYYIIAGPVNLRTKMTYDRDIFKEMIELPFEDRTYQAIACWDYFLSLRYGDYMELPAEEERCATHNYNEYWR